MGPTARYCLSSHPAHEPWSALTIVLVDCRLFGSGSPTAVRGRPPCLGEPVQCRACIPICIQRPDTANIRERLASRRELQQASHPTSAFLARSMVLAAGRHETPKRTPALHRQLRRRESCASGAGTSHYHRWYLLSADRTPASPSDQRRKACNCCPLLCRSILTRYFRRCLHMS